MDKIILTRKNTNNSNLINVTFNQNTLLNTPGQTGIYIAKNYYLNSFKKYSGVYTNSLNHTGPGIDISDNDKLTIIQQQIDNTAYLFPLPPTIIIQEVQNNINRADYYDKSVLMEADVPANFLKTCLSTVNFNYDYSLCPNTPNSQEDNSGNYGGKLALLSVNFGGYGDERVIPPYLFTYNNGPGYSTNQVDYWGYASEYDPALFAVIGTSDLALKRYTQAWSLKIDHYSLRCCIKY